MRPVSFAEFFDACKDRLTDGQLRTLDAGSDYYEQSGTFWGWRVEKAGIWLSIVVGDISGLWRLRKLLEETGARYIGWECREDSPSYAWGRYWKARIEDVGSRYPDGAIAWRVTLDVAQTRRLRKNVAPVALVAVASVKD